MSKVAFITDTHLGARSDHAAFTKANKDFFPRFFGDLYYRGITEIYHLGDLVDRRKEISIEIIKHAHEDFLQMAADQGIKVKLLVGNHDCPYRNTNKVNAVRELTKNYTNVKVFEEPTEHDSFLILPWINTENASEAVKLVTGSSKPFVLGHLELMTFMMTSGSVCEHGLDPKVFKKFKGVYSGHFHKKQSKGNVHYIGSHSQFNWDDHGDERGYSIFDTETGELEFIENQYRMFEKVTWSGDKPKLDDMPNVDSRFVKVVVEQVGDEKKLADFLDTMNQASGAASVTTVDRYLVPEVTVEQWHVEGEPDVMDIFRELMPPAAIDELGLDPMKLFNFIESLYVEAKA